MSHHCAATSASSAHSKRRKRRPCSQSGTLRNQLAWRVTLYIASFLPLTAATCYYRDGSTASTYVQCPGANFCCDEVRFCESNGLCRDKNNHANGSVTYFPNDKDPGPYNFTGLYQTPTCNNVAFNGCDEECTASDADTFAYIWACTSNLRNYCCHNNAVALNQRDCCSDDTRFQLSSPAALVPSSTPASTVTTSTSTKSSASPFSTQNSGTGSSSGSGSSLTEGDIIGVAVAVPVFVILVIAIIILFLRQNKINKRLQQGNSEQRQPSDQPPVAYARYEDDANRQQMTQRYGRAGAELDVDGQRNELPADRQRNELPTEHYKPANPRQGPYELH